MASRPLCYSRSVILDVLRAIVSRSPPPPSIVVRRGYSQPCHASFITRAPLHHPNSTSLPRRFYHTKPVEPLVQELEVMDVLQELEPEQCATRHERSIGCRRDHSSGSGSSSSSQTKQPLLLPKRCIKWLEPKRNSLEQFNRDIYYAVLQQQMNKAVKLLKEMEKRGLHPDVATYTMIINGYSRATDMERAVKWFHRMKRNNVEPDVFTYTSMIDGYMRMADVPSAEQLFRSMMLKGIRPTRVTYNILMHQSVMQLDIETAVRFWGKLVEAGLRPDVYTYAIMIHGMGMEGQLDKAWRLYDTMVRQNIDVNEVVATSLMGMHVKAHDNNHAIELFRQFFVHERRPPTAHTRNVLLNALVAGADLATIQSYYRKYLDYLSLSKDQRAASAAAPTTPVLFTGAHVVTFTTFMRSFLRRDDLPMVSQVYQDMMARGIKPTLVTYAILMLAHAYIPDPHSCHKILQEIKAAGLTPNAVLYTIVMRAWAKAGHWEETKKIYEEMKDANIQPTKMTMSVLQWSSTHRK